MSTSRTKRWNGTLESLSADFLKAVLEHMESYGDQVQFEYPGHGKRPIYQILCRGGRKMGFDGKHLLLRLNENGNVSDNLSSVFTLDTVRDAVSDKRPTRVRATTRSAAQSRGRSARRATAVSAADTIEQEKYIYYREHRDTLPEGIARYAEEISTLMRAGNSAEAAFRQVIERYF